MKKIICYGDSNTFGVEPGTMERYNINSRWSGIVLEHYKNIYEVIEEGMPNRNAIANNIEGELYTAIKHIPTILPNYNNAEIFVLAVGTNDCQFQYNLSMSEIIDGLKSLLDIIRQYTQNVIVLSPVIPTANLKNGYFINLFNEDSINKAKVLNKVFKEIVDSYKLNYIDLNQIVMPSIHDGLHYNKQSHEIIAQKVINIIDTIS